VNNIRVSSHLANTPAPSLTIMYIPQAKSSSPKQSKIDLNATSTKYMYNQSNYRSNALPTPLTVIGTSIFRELEGFCLSRRVATVYLVHS